MHKRFHSAVKADDSSSGKFLFLVSDKMSWILKVNWFISLPSFVALPQTPLLQFPNLITPCIKYSAHCFSFCTDADYIPPNVLLCSVAFRACVSLASKNRMIGNAAKSQVRSVIAFCLLLVFFPKLHWLHSSSGVVKKINLLLALFYKLVNSKIVNRFPLQCIYKSSRKRWAFHML